MNKENNAKQMYTLVNSYKTNTPVTTTQVKK